jgi:hypothetical protein
MWSRIITISIAIFFIVMNVLLWRWEVVGHRSVGSPVPVQTVWGKVLTAPDFSALEIRHHGERIGWCRWVPAIGEDHATGRRMSEELPPEGMVKRAVSYTLDLNGTLLVGQDQRIRFSADLKLSTNHQWQEFSLRLQLRPSEWTIRASVAEQKLYFTVNNDGARSERVLTFEELRDPDKLLRELGGPLLPATLGAMGITVPSVDAAQSLSLGLKWEAHQDRLTIGNAHIRGYRLRARLFDRYQVVLFVSAVGEIMRVELPDEVVLRNEALATLYVTQPAND